MRRPAAVALLVATVTAGGVAPTARGQSPVAVLRGVAYDSVRGRPLGGAFVTLDGGRNTETDSRGRFQFDSVAAGEHLVSVQHAALDSLGFNGLSVRTRVAGGTSEVRVATPSFTTMWNAACRPGKPPRDSGLVYGTVVDAASRRPLAGALVGLTWLDLGVSRKRDVNMQQFAGAGRANAEGSYVICGVPVGVGVRMQASADSIDSGLLELAPGDRLVRRQDFAIALAGGEASAQRGIVVGRITGVGGAPLANARIFIDGDTIERRTDERGTFVARGVPSGSRQIEALAVGMSPKATVVEVTPNDTARFAVQLDRVQTLDVIRVTSTPGGRRRALEVYERKRSGLGYFRDSSHINTHSPLSTVFDMFPATRVDRIGGTRFRLRMRDAAGHYCAAQLYVDGIRSDQDVWLDVLTPDEIAVIEVYPRGSSVPVEFTSVKAGVMPCGAAAIWTKRGFK